MSMYIELFIVFFTSLFIGSFFNVLIDRIYRDEQFVKGKSYCEACKKTLSLFDLIPVLSFVLLKGKCRYCGAKIPVWLPIVEIVTALIFSFTYYKVFSDPLNLFDLKNTFIYFLFLLVLLSCFILIFLQTPDILLSQQCIYMWYW